MLSKEINVQNIMDLITADVYGNKLRREDFYELFKHEDEATHKRLLRILRQQGIELVDELPPEQEYALALPYDVRYKELLESSNEELCLQYQQGSSKAMEALIVKNDAFVHKAAWKLLYKYKSDQLTIDDYVSNGYIGMLKAARRFEGERGLKFLTYAWHYIRSEIVRSVTNAGYVVRLPAHVADKIFRLNNCLRANEHASIAELQEHLLAEYGEDWTRQQIEEYLGYLQRHRYSQSLNQPKYEDNEDESGELIEDRHACIITKVLQKSLRTTLDKIVEKMPYKERQLIKLRYGWEDGVLHTLEEIGQSLQPPLSRERVRQIELRAMRHLRFEARKQGLEEFLSSDTWQPSLFAKRKGTKGYVTEE